MLKEAITEFIFKRALEDTDIIQTEEERQEQDIIEQKFEEIQERVRNFFNEQNKNSLFLEYDDQRNFLESIIIEQAYKKGFKDSFKLFIELSK